MTQAQIARQAGVTQQWLNQVVRGETETTGKLIVEPGIHRLQRVHDVLAYGADYS